MGKATSFGLDTIRTTLVHERRHRQIYTSFKAAEKNGTLAADDPDDDGVLTEFENLYKSDPNEAYSWVVDGYSVGAGEEEYICRRTEEGVELTAITNDWMSGELGKQWNNGQETIK